MFANNLAARCDEIRLEKKNDLSPWDECLA